MHDRCKPLCGASHCEVAVVAVVVRSMAMVMVMMIVAMAVGRLAVRWRSLRRRQQRASSPVRSQSPVSRRWTSRPSEELLEVLPSVESVLYLPVKVFARICIP